MSIRFIKTKMIKTKRQGEKDFENWEGPFIKGV